MQRFSTSIMYPKSNIVDAEGSPGEWTAVIYIFGSNIHPSLEEQFEII